MMHKYLLITLALLLTSAAGAQVLEQDSLALVALYNSTNGDNWTDNSGWFNGPVSTWYGIVLNGDRVHRLEMWSNNLSGPIPDEIGNLTAMQSIHFSGNALTGQIPESIGNCTELNYIDVHVNMLTGTIPMTLSNCQNLTGFVGYKNDFSGVFPEVLLGLPNLDYFDISTNHFHGQIPPALDTLSQLRTMVIGKNDFSGPMPSIRNMSSLVELHMSNNALSGDIDTILGYHPNLYYVTFDYCNFTGCVSESSFNPAKLQFLHFTRNAIDCMGDFSAFADTGVLERIWCNTNMIPFEYLEQNTGVGIFEYAPQDSLLAPETHVLMTGDTLEIYSGTGGMYTNYTWFRNGEILPGEHDPVLRIENFQPAAAGTYYAMATNDSLPLLTLYRHQVHVQPETSSVRDTRTKPLQILPNPANDIVSFEGMTGHGTVEVFDLRGHLVLRQYAELAAPFSVEKLFQGIYLVRIGDGATTFSGLLTRF